MKASTVVCTASLLLAMHAVFADAVKASGEYPEFYSGNSAKGIDFVQSIKVLTPRYCTNVKGSFKIVFEAKGMTQALARCWKSGGEWGANAVLADLKLGADGLGEFTFPADEFPNGPLTIRIQAIDGKGHQDYCELQLYNLGGVKWKQGIPKADPPGAKGMKLVYSEGRATTATVRLGNPDHPGAGDICALTTLNPKTRHHDKTKLHP